MTRQSTQVNNNQSDVLAALFVFCFCHFLSYLHISLMFVQNDVNFYVKLIVTSLSVECLEQSCI